MVQKMCKFFEQVADKIFYKHKSIIYIDVDIFLHRYIVGNDNMGGEEFFGTTLLKIFV